MDRVLSCAVSRLCRVGIGIFPSFTWGLVARFGREFFGSVCEGDSYSAEEPSSVDVFWRLRVVECGEKFFELPGARTICTWFFVLFSKCVFFTKSCYFLLLG